MTKAWLDDDEVTTTFRSLKQAQVEAAMAERKRIVALLQSMDAEQGMSGHNEKPSSVCRICRAITNIEGDGS
jgi:hypothetical protein